LRFGPTSRLTELSVFRNLHEIILHPIEHPYHGLFESGTGSSLRDGRSVRGDRRIIWWPWLAALLLRLFDKLLDSATKAVLLQFLPNIHRRR
jgi:hypothetical protein